MLVKLCDGMHEMILACHHVPKENTKEKERLGLNPTSGMTDKI